MSTAPYQVWVFDCPACGGQTMIESGLDPEEREECADCGAVVEMER
jgi:hypothetical protein